MLGRRPALRASAQSATGSFSFKNENALLSLFTASAWAPSCSPSPDRALRRWVTRPSVPPRPWIPGCPLVPVHYGPTVSTTCTSYSLTSGVSHTQGGRQPRAHPALPESTPNPLYLPHTPSPNTSGPAARQQRAAPKPQVCRNYWSGQVSSCAACPALPLPHRSPGQASPTCLPALVPRWAWKHGVPWVHVLSHLCKTRRQSPRPQHRSPRWPATLQSRCRASPPPTAWPGCGSGCSCVPPSTGRP